ncbi:hypothetical protein [Halorubrum sp. DTA46]|uniref:hypothetical protein n=1 Tax=Halorubrum sp. DTA46 TaxID=3402162 RepID=UPI003AAC1DDB
MERRAFLADTVAAAAVVGGTGGIAGCADLAGGDESPATRDPPPRPTELTPDAVAAYVADYEAVRVHNHHVERGATDVSVDAVATFDHAAGDEHYATAQHAGTLYDTDSDGNRSVGELSSAPVPYLVTPDRTLRMDTTRRSIEGDERDRAPDETASPPLGVRLLNVTDEPREVAVRVVRRTDAIEAGEDELGADSNDGELRVDARDGDAAATEGDALVAEPTVTAEPRSAVELRAITAVRGGYRITASSETNGVTSLGRIEVGLPSADREPNVDIVVDGDGLSTRHLPSFEPI